MFSGSAFQILWDNLQGMFLNVFNAMAPPEQVKQGIALTGRNRTGPPYSVGHQTAHAPDPAAVDCPRARRSVRPPSGSVTDDNRRQTPASKTILAH